MKNNKQQLLIQQTDKKLAVFTPLTSTIIPPKGWINTVRTSLNISLRQLGNRLKISSQSVKEIEEREANGTITLNSLKDAANELDLKLVYGFVSKHGSIEKMIRLKLLSVYITIASATCLAQQHGSFTDPRDGRVHKTVKIGSQVWMAENLNVATFQNGDSIPEAKTIEAWIRAGEMGAPVWCYYENDSIGGSKYGRLYNWYAVNDSRGIAPRGWKVPNYDEDWEQLKRFLGMQIPLTTGKRLKSVSNWAPYGGTSGQGTDLYGFAAIPAGYRTCKGKFSSIEKTTCFWSFGKDKFGQAATSHSLDYDSDIMYNSNENSTKCHGYSVRCLKILK